MKRPSLYTFFVMLLIVGYCTQLMVAFSVYAHFYIFEEIKDWVSMMWGIVKSPTWSERPLLWILLLLALALRFRFAWIGLVFVTKLPEFLLLLISQIMSLPEPEPHRLWGLMRILALALLLTGSTGLFLATRSILTDWIKSGLRVSKLTGYGVEPMLRSILIAQFGIFFVVGVFLEFQKYLPYKFSETPLWQYVYVIGESSQFFVILLLMIWALIKGYMRILLLYALYLPTFIPIHLNTARAINRYDAQSWMASLFWLEWGFYFFLLVTYATYAYRAYQERKKRVGGS